MIHEDEQVNIPPEQRFDTSIEVPAGSSYAVARKLVALADQKMYEAKRSFAGSPDPHIAQIERPHYERQTGRDVSVSVCDSVSSHAHLRI